MTMNKKEQAALAQAQHDLAEARALRWSDYPAEPDVPVPVGAERFSSGWAFSAHTQEVWRAWSDAHRHGHGSAPNGFAASQGGRPLYSTKRRALWALRRAVERDAAVKLAQIDADIGEEE